MDRELREALDKLQIQEALITWCRGVDRCDVDLINSVYTEDARDEHGAAGDLHAPDIGAALVKKLRELGDSSFHRETNVSIRLKGDVAYSESYSRNVHLFERDGKPMVTEAYGRYIDRWERRSGAWKIAHRIMVGFASNEYPVTRESGIRSEVGSRSREDPSYRDF